MAPRQSRTVAVSAGRPSGRSLRWSILPRAAHQRRHRELASQLADIGLIAQGSCTRRYTRCGTPGCRWHGELAQPHGPAYQWTAKVAGKTVHPRLTEVEGRLYQEWIDNDRQLRTLIGQMREVAASATELIMKEASGNHIKV